VQGPLVEAAGWAALYAALGRAYSAVAATSRRGAVVRIVGLALLLALLSAQLGRIVSGVLVTPLTWNELFYVKRLLPPLLVGFWCTVLLPAETRALVHALWDRRSLAPLPQLAVLLAAAALLVSCGDLGLEWSGESAVGRTLKAETIYREAWTANILLLFSAYAIVLALTARLSAALLLISPVYLVFGLATLLKIRYMHSAIQPLDFLKIGELLPILPSFLGWKWLSVAAVAVGVWLVALVSVRRRPPRWISPWRRWCTGLAALGGLLLFPVAYYTATPVADDVGDALSPSDVLLSRFNIRGREFKELARVRGFLISFVSELPAMAVVVPPGYSRATVQRAVGRHCAPASRGQPPRVNLIVYLVESFMDPDDLGIRFTTDPIPTVRALRRSQVGGYAIVPHEFGGSADTEFELLSGMSTAFLPEGSVAYRSYLTRSIPSVSGLLRELGYTTTAVQPDPKHYYERQRAYQLLGFEHAVWLGDSAGVERAPRGLWPSDASVVSAVIQATQAARPAFVFAFPSSTHFPYGRGTYRNSKLDPLDVPSADATAEVKEYVNALRDADRAIGTLVDYFRQRPDSTIIAVLGDHLPPLPEGALRTFLGRQTGMSPLERARMRRRVPLLVWANFPIPRQDMELSTNLLPSYLLHLMGVAPPPPWLAITDALRQRLPVLTTYAQGDDGVVRDRAALPGLERELVEDYRLLQYDLLLGEQYAVRPGAQTASACSEERDGRSAREP
jgi:hypothetical protein